MQSATADPVTLWRHNGLAIVTQNFRTFRGIVAQTADFARTKQYEMAAIYADLAADYAFSHHSGLFSSQELERILVGIGREAVPAQGFPVPSSSMSRGVQRVLHVATGFTSIGGIGALIRRWIRQDSARSHSLVFTRQLRAPIPDEIRTAVSNSGGSLYRLNTAAGSLIRWARRLRKLSLHADIVVLHTSTSDVIPILAFADTNGRPPVIYIDHADHVFSLGLSVSDLYADLRRSRMELAQKRRGVLAERSALLPTPVVDVRRTRQRIEAKRQLGLPADCVLLVSVARKLKFRTIGGLSYVDAHLPLLDKHNNAILITVGSGVPEDWANAIQRARGRIIALGELENPGLYLEAADIYVDSFPFISNTSLLEAGSYGLPLVSRYPFPPGCEVLGADMPGLTKTLIRAGSIDEYRAELSRLIEDESYRLSLGEATRKNVLAAHMGTGWQRSLEDIYNKAAVMPRNDASYSAADGMTIEDLDLLMPQIHNCTSDGRTPSMQELVWSRLRLMPLRHRVRHWFGLIQGNAGRRLDGLPYMVPEWLISRTRFLWKRMCVARQP